MKYVKESQSDILKNKISENHYWNKSLHFRNYPNGIILPYNPRIGFLTGGVINSEGIFIEDSALHEEYYDGSYKFEEKEIIYNNRDAVFLGTWIGIYGHAITDNIKKLWFLNTPEFRELFMDKEVDLLFNFLGEKIPSYIYDILDLLGIEKDRIKRAINIQKYNNVFVPDNSLILHKKTRYYTNEYKNLIDKIIANSRECKLCEKINSNKIYLTRSKLNNRKDFGENKIENDFKKSGWTIMSPENYSIQNQVNIYQSCNVIACTEGSISHNLLFCNEGTEAILLRKADFINGYQVMINEMRKIKVTYIDAHHTIKKKNQPWSGPFFLWETKYFNSYFGISGEKNRWLSALWYLYLLRICRIYVGKKKQNFMNIIKKLCQKI